MKNLLHRVSLVLIVSLLGACAHPIVITPDVSKFTALEESKRSKAIVGYFISAEERTKKNITAGGGGDKVEHATTKDLESGLYRIFNNTFADVHQLNSPNDVAILQSKNITFVVRPTISANSSSNSLFTWPPTDFEVTIQISASDATGKEVWRTVASGKGKAEFSEFKGDFGLAGKRASEAALVDLQAKLSQSPLITR
jgi:hypothetical protein